ncbi:acetylhydrolase [Amycolatopsis sp. NPDC004625]|uniref:alpha/beta hydrolase family protein n=1 Tax=Amycolatopsis sp. NPDC004625 TaxID=3154670 RepID=UPI0033A9DC3B
MAFPATAPPITIDGRRYLDGGLWELAAAAVVAINPDPAAMAAFGPGLCDRAACTRRRCPAPDESRGWCRPDGRCAADGSVTTLSTMIMSRLLTVVAVLLLGLSAPASAAEPTALLSPDGKYPIGLRTLHLTDTGRADPWVPSERRELMVSLWYPAFPAGERADYLTAAESAATVKGRGLDLPADTLQRIGVHARKDAPALPSAGRGRPLVLLSPGAGNSRTTLTTLAENLAANGFVVAAVDHAYEAYNVEFPGGRLLPCLACQAPGEPWPAAVENRAEDMSFVVDTVLGQRSPRIDPARIGMAGHSAGGAATAFTMAADRRVKAGVSLDGPLYRPVALDRPFALLTSPVGEQQFGAGWDAGWPALTGWKERRHLPQTGHSSSTDNGYLTVALHQKDKVPPATWERQYGSGDPTASLEFFRDYLVGFFQARLNPAG